MADHGSQRGAGARADKPRPIWRRESSLAGGAWGGEEESRARHCAQAQRVLVFFGKLAVCWPALWVQAREENDAVPKPRGKKTAEVAMNVNRWVEPGKPGMP